MPLLQWIQRDPLVIQYFEPRAYYTIVIRLILQWIFSNTIRTSILCRYCAHIIISWKEPDKREDLPSTKNWKLLRYKIMGHRAAVSLCIQSVGCSACICMHSVALWGFLIVPVLGLALDFSCFSQFLLYHSIYSFILRIFRAPLELKETSSEANQVQWVRNLVRESF